MNRLDRGNRLAAAQSRTVFHVTMLYSCGANSIDPPSNCAHLIVPTTNCAHYDGMHDDGDDGSM